MSVYKRGKSWYIDVVLGGTRINRKGGDTKKEAQNIESELKRRLRMGRLNIEDIQRDRFFGSVADKYLLYLKASYAPRTHHGVLLDYKNHVSPFFSDMILQDISNSTLLEFQASCKEGGYSNRSCNMYMALVRRIMTFARDYDYIGELKLKFPMLTEPKKHHAALSPQEFRQLVESFDPQAEIAMMRTIFGRLTGLRPGELTYLAWTDIDFNLKIIHVQAKEGWTPKALKERIVPLSVEALEVLSDLKKRRYGPWVFSTTDNPVKSIRRALITASKKAGIKNVTPNMLRHTFATHVLLSGGDVRALQELMGHSSLGTTNKYTHTLQEHLRTTVDRIHALKND